DVVRIATAHMKLPIHIEVAPSGTTAERITQELFIVKKENKGKLLGKILKQYNGSVLLFSRTKRGAAKITRALREKGWRAAEIHSDKSLPQRREALEGFKSGKYRVLVATDIAARGIDVVGIELVINYDLPEDAENYVHRIGRTGRAGHDGHAIAIATPDQALEVRNIEKLIKTALPITEHPEFPKETFHAITEEHTGPKYGGSQHRHPYRGSHPVSGGHQRFGKHPSHQSRYPRKHY
ncbi:MAG: C-terminal helicase domain-containing protein, partial [Candidatus Omnitrophota bacterium]